MGAIAKAQGSAIQRSQGNDFKALLESQWDKIAQVAPKHLSKDRLFQLSVSAYNQTPGLSECTPVSVLSCVMKCAALGMEPSAVDGLGRAYILPYYNGKTKRKEATFILGYKGMVDLARRSGEIKSISARAVHQGDLFEYEYGLEEALRHVPGDGPQTPDTLTHVYVVAHFKDGGHFMDVMTRAQVDEVRKCSKASQSGPWVTDYEAMAVKTVIRRAFKFLPVSVESQAAAVADETTPSIEGVDFGPMPTQEEQDEVIDAEVIEDRPAHRKAVCRNCGVVVDVAPDATLDDLASMGCCDAPSYEFEG